MPLPSPSNSGSGSLPDMLQARLRQGLANWTKRTFLWGALFAIFSVHFPFLKAVLVGWIIFSAISLAFLLLGLKIAKNLKGTTVSFGMGGMPAGQEFPTASLQEEPPPRAPASSANPSEVIEIDAEVLPPETPPPHRTPRSREIQDA
ncbi:MAG: hypothetical protein JWM59_4750 [Verrucomicrobiales bacterium]|nr:hypothetical protein [Verrucomicrobiales bacterium]